ncbi:MAG TPA: RDD family protein, partial [Pyrinomonadaceae bacterium]|nr:RDD family protein [Pyrinomonadaceae bacterium]
IAVVLISADLMGYSAIGTPGEESLFADAPKWAVAILVIAVFAIYFGYFIFFEWWWDGQTPGKRMMKLRVIREDGRPVTIFESAVRNLLRLIDTMPGPMYSIGLITIFLSPKDQRVGDIFGGTVVIRERSDEAPTFAETFSNPIADAAFRRVQPATKFNMDVGRLTEAEVEVAENLLRRRWDLSQRQRDWMAWRVGLPLMYKLKPDYDLETFTYEGFLEEVVHRHHARKRYLN